MQVNNGNAASQPLTVVPQGCTYDPKTGKIFRLMAAKVRQPAFQALERQLETVKLNLATYMQEHGYKYHVGTKQVLQGNTPITTTPEHQALIDAVKTSQQAIKAYKQAHKGEFTPQVVLPRRRRGKRSIGSVPIVEGSIPTKQPVTAQPGAINTIATGVAAVTSSVTQMFSGSGQASAQTAAITAEVARLAAKQEKLACSQVETDQKLSDILDNLNQLSQFLAQHVPIKGHASASAGVSPTFGGEESTYDSEEDKPSHLPHREEL